ncbi:DNA-directed RNA polymerase I subunit RPA1 [Bacillus rossius redtenbacheri]|uniref:DNA-directed RNA polymerase I subunit RPA1 n=1 Tax=Bacillus rossius redtenbacheri TaxID=93214 RepID=UPI002FDDA2FB
MEFPRMNAVSASFSLFSGEEIKKLSVVRISTPLVFNVLGHPLPGGLYDPSLGPMSERSDPCKTCHRNYTLCPGHFGYIELPLPVVNPMYYKHVYTLLRMLCLSCRAFQVPEYLRHLLSTQLELLDAGLLSEAQDAELVVAEAVASCKQPSALHEEAFGIAVRERLDAYRREVLGGAPDDDQTCAQTKNTEYMRNRLMEAVWKLVAEVKKCWKCKKHIKKITSFQNRLLISVTKVETSSKFQTSSKDPIMQSAKSKSEITMIMPTEQREYLRKMWEANADFVACLFPVLKKCSYEHPTDLFFLDIVPVIPPRMRPVNFVDGRLVEHPQNEVYKHILEESMVLRNATKAEQAGRVDGLSEEGKTAVEQARGATFLEKVHFVWQQIQAHVDHLLDAGFSPAVSSGKNISGLKQLMEKKEGLIRMHMMGKRVNYAARSVITPDPYLNIDEVGVPEVFASVLTYPTRVTTWNVKELRQMIINGPKIYPGAVMVELSGGRKVLLKHDDEMQRSSYAKRLLTQDESNANNIKVVHRHLLSGDVLLLNRQPTLHKPSIMAHTARILPGEKTLRLHYANCKAYNADFDGDEMNAHFAQSELGRSEAYNLLSVNNQYAVPKDGTPLSGLMQDHVISGVQISLRGRFFTREDYQQFVFVSLANKRGHIRLLPPAILKPRQLWSGKQILSTIIINSIPKGKHPINLAGVAKIASKAWEVRKPRRWKAGGTPFPDASTMSEAEVVVRRGELLCGVLDKAHYGATPYGLVHCMYELYGGACSGRILSSFSKLFTSFLQRRGFTLGIEDILILDGAERERTAVIEEARKVGPEVVMSVLSLEEGDEGKVEAELEKLYRTGVKGRAVIDRAYKTTLDTVTDKINKACLPAGLLRQFPANNLQLMIESGAKGSKVNAMQISCLLGQIELEGKRPPLMKSCKSLPSFARLDTTPRAGGFIDGRFLTGIQPQEFFFHCMAGREGLIDTAVKTSRSGYLQRCLIKHLEGVTVQYDQTVRDSDGSVIQFCYGEDGRDVLRAQFLKLQHMPFLAENCQAILESEKEMTKLLDDEDMEAVQKQRRAIHKWMKKNGSVLQKRLPRPFTRFSREVDPSTVTNSPDKLLKKQGRVRSAHKLCKMWSSEDAETRARRQRCEGRWGRCPDPVAAAVSPARTLGAVTEQLEQVMAQYRGGKLASGRDPFQDMVYLKSLTSLAVPGEPVGLLAAQSIGEPSTQMTLNTFHFAGRGDMNVTLGIPRLREILMIASKNIKTPSMEIPFRTDVRRLGREAERLRRRLTRVTVSSVLEHITVTDCISLHPSRRRVYVVRLQFLPWSCYRTDYCVKPSHILHHVEKKLVTRILTEMKKRLKFHGGLLHSENEGQRKKRNEDEDEGGEGEAVETEASLERMKRSSRHDDEDSSEEEFEGEEADATEARTHAKHSEEQEYDDPGDSDRDEEEEEGSADEEKEAGKLDNTVPDPQSRDSGEDDSDEEDEDKVPLVEEHSGKVRRSHVVGIHTFVEDYEYDKENELWCEITFGLPLMKKKLDMSTLLRNVVEKSVVWEVADIRRAFTFVSPDTGLLTLKTEGINIHEMFKFRHLLDLDKLYTNDIYGMSQTYGIEAARRVIIKEVQDVFRMYGITVDPRHLLLVADYMTSGGQFDPFSRKGLDLNVSPLQKMSFEASLGFLRTATLQGKTDVLKSPSSRIMVGQPCLSGTAVCSVFQKLVVT